MYSSILQISHLIDHSDPHPGNLLRTPDGRLCILDWGMVTRLDKDLQLTLITHMAHLTSRDYEEIPRDLLLLGFIPQSKANLIEDSGIVEVLADIYGAWTDGGGAASINVNKVISQLQDLTATKGNLFQIPPYFAFIAKCFSVLEGIGLSNDSRYSIINECLPYVSKRLLTDKDARTGAALSTFIFGPDKHNLGTRLVDYKRVEQLVEGFSSYTSSSSGIRSRKENLTRTQLLESSADQVLELVFSDDETPLQSILIEQVAKIIGASSRSIWAEILEASGTLPTGRTVLGTMVDPFGLWRTSPLIRMNKMDATTIETTQKLITLVQSQVNQSNNPMLDLSTVSRDEAMELAAIIASKVWERRRGVVKTGGRLAYEIMRLTSKKLESGDRGELLIPSSIQTNLKQNHLQTNEPKKIVEEKESERLLNARQRLIALTDQIDI
jgi:ABC1 atypical kinase-like domain